MKSFLFFCLLSGSTVVFAQNDTLPVTYLKTHGVKINVTGMDKAIEFYNGKMGFAIIDKKHYPQMVVLNSNSTEGNIYLNLVNNLAPQSEKDVRAGISFQVNNLDSAMAVMKNRGKDFGKNQKRKEGVGNAISFEDPFGTPLSIMHVTIVQQPHFTEPKIYNYGMLITDMDTARLYFKRLGFVERSKRYLPLDMPLGHPDKTFAFMLHYRDGVENIHYNTSNDEHVVILFKTTDIPATVQQMKKAGVQFVQTKIQEGLLGKWISFRDKFGLVYDLVEVK